MFLKCGQKNNKSYTFDCECSDNVKECEECSSTVFCTGCGEACRKKDVYCNKCGERI